MSDWTVEIDGVTYHPVPQTWVEHPNAADESPAVEDPRLYAVSVAGVADGFALRVRYADKREHVWTDTQDALVQDSKIVPRAIEDPADQWARSKAASPRETGGVLRGPEIEHFDTLWSDELERQRVAADGGERR